MYYALQVRPDTLRKDDATADLDEGYENIFNEVLEEQLEEQENNHCSACAE
jgi:hypothetical protein